MAKAARTKEIVLDLKLWPRQLQALESPATEILFGGATEGGKSHLVRVMLIAYCLQIPNLQCVLIRKKFSDILSNHVDSPTGFRVLLKDLIEIKEVKITESGVYFSNGSIIQFQHCQDERQFTSAQGIEKHVLVIDEATQIPARLIEFFRAWVRMPKEFKAGLPEQYRDKLPLIMYTANPIGSSVAWFRRHFVNARPAFAIEKVHGFLRQYIPSRANDNLSVDLEAHFGRLAGLNDSALAQALDTGDWDSPLGDFFKGYDDSRHRVPDFSPPEHWRKYRTYDWGQSDPAFVQWWTVSDGQEFEHDNRAMWFPRGSLICYREWNICKDDDPAKGCEMSNDEQAQGILDRTPANEHIELTLTDSLPFQNRGESKNNKKWVIADTFRRAGVPLTRANTDRVFGCNQIKDRLKGKDGWPLMYFTESCKYSREYLPSIERDKNQPEACADSGEASHSVDCTRYAAATNALPKDAKPVAEDLESVKYTPKGILQRLKRKNNIRVNLGRR